MDKLYMQYNDINNLGINTKFIGVRVSLNNKNL